MEEQGIEQVKLDTFTVDPCSIRKEQLQHYDKFKIKMIFGDACENPACKAAQYGLADISQLCTECEPATIDDRNNWNLITKIVQKRNEKYQISFENGQALHFGGEQSDWDTVLQNGADEAIYGRYKDIEHLGHDIDFSQQIEYRPSLTLKS